MTIRHIYMPPFQKGGGLNKIIPRPSNTSKLINDFSGSHTEISIAKSIPNSLLRYAYHKNCNKVTYKQKRNLYK